MGLIFLIVLGATLGWLVTVSLPAADSRAMVMYVCAGIGGALAGGLLVSPLIGEGNLLNGTYRVGAIMVAFVGSCLALLSANLLRRSEMR